MQYVQDCISVSFLTFEQVLNIFDYKNILDISVTFAVTYIGFIFLQACNREPKVENCKQFNFVGSVSSRPLIFFIHNLF